MSSTPEITSIVIENGTHTTRAGFSTETLPSLEFPTVYSTESTSDPENPKYLFDDDIKPENEVFTIVNEGVVYNWKALEQSWAYIFAKLKVDPKEFPLVITEELWNNKKNRVKLAELAFVKFGVPVFTILKSPIAITYGLGRSTSLVVDIGSSRASVTPILDGTILYKGAAHSKFAGDFLNVHTLKFLENSTNFDYVKGSESYKVFQTNKLLTDFKSTINSVSTYPIVNSNADFQISPKNYQLPDSKTIEVRKEQVLLSEPLFHPLSYPIPGIELPKDSVGLTDLILSALKKLDVTQDIYASLLNNIILTGGTSLLPGLETRLISDLSRFLTTFGVQSFSNPTLSERSNATWIGASVLASMNSFENHYISKEDFEEQGEAIVDEKLK
ncbi:Actin, cytoplasmic type 5 [Wickerhamomyces ciferrii]|uniref:Actin, cytoplasmic type 5 n=1 Tax=Wickerhamomyces ciferrii (strain ATCC 14091 / BCRC 22168 / CBS 111 / JCM 3599 / NBRC 0793 / NRRL Y-1031 F-60-10) TaxID=1206466 RepID=K0KJD1_WICCF|nr:Actin, cytoplasmic type 5 [Wickerhamomyces ciferrii]CCH45340.1 Actin, cytoplasmic type 5 [Wickerhamomyces ciferrii]